uniref:F-box/LRR-repeat protein At3g58900-like n=1 Tax=Fragaria vesca subsp. vesca TaxID=101020 RepID=UPI0005C9F53C|nr:PREDICTED: F-box/LRR-repeat protein At3g58900-like [Fragaria vesca subsp. vesca]
MFNTVKYLVNNLRTSAKDDSNLGKRRESEDKHNYLVDRISLLPYEVLVSIASLLSLKEAAATSVLSRRWKNVWKYTTTLNFQDLDLFVGDNFYCLKLLEENLRDEKSRKYVDWVDRVLVQHEGHTIERFKAFFFLNNIFKNSIDKWIEFAMQKRVQVLELQFFIKQYDFTIDNYEFPQNLIGLGGEGEYSNHIPTQHLCRYNNVGFKFLKVLRLQQICLTDEVLEYFLSNCPVLERLTVTVARGLVCVRVVGPSISLKYLAILDCPNLKSIEICNPNIASFVYMGACIDLLINNVPLLIEVHISERALHYVDFTTVAFNRLSFCLSHLEILKLNISGVVYNPNYDFPVLENLKQLELNVETNYQWALYHLYSFMKACPHIHRLILKLEFQTYVETIVSKAPKFSHHSLKVVEIMGYRGYQCAVEHVVYLIENVVALEKIIIDPVRRWIWPPGMDRGTEMVKEEVKGRKHAKEHLKERVPSTLEFECL